MKVTKYSKRVTVLESTPEFNRRLYTPLIHLDNGVVGSYQEIISQYGYTPWFKSGWHHMIINNSVVK